MKMLVRHTKTDAPLAVAVSEDIGRLQEEAHHDALKFGLNVPPTDWSGDLSPYFIGINSDTTFTITYYIREVKVV